MKTKGRINKNNFKGISLIVLVITIIVIIILAATIIITLTNNNPISEANKARYESDRDNMQSIFTNTVAKVMAQKQGSIKIEAGQLNSVKSGVSSTTGIANYTLEGIQDSSKASGTIEFDNKENEENKYYTGKQLPIYKAGDTTWSVDEEGVLKLSVGGNEYVENGGSESTPGGNTSSGVTISEEEYEKLKNAMAQVETLKTRIENIEKQPKNIERVILSNKITDIPLTTSTINDNDFTNITLSDSVENYKYIEINTEIFNSLNSSGCYPKTEIISVNQLKYNNSNIGVWDDSSIINFMTSDSRSFFNISGWFKNNKLLHIGGTYTNDTRYTWRYRIKSIYGIR